MKQYLYLVKKEEDSNTTIKDSTTIIERKLYNEDELIEVDEFVKPRDFFGIVVNEVSYFPFCNVLEEKDGVMRNIIVCYLW